MKTLIAAVIFTAVTSAQAMQPQMLTIDLQCWPTKVVAEMVEKKLLLVSRFYDASFSNGEGRMAELIHVKDRNLIWFAMDQSTACMIAVAEPHDDDLKRVGLR